jgi:RimJ/RimL family protein N-acetyltransferase
MSEFRDRVADDYAATTLDAFMLDWQRRAAAGQQSWAIYRDGELGGLVTLDLANPGVGSTHCLFVKRMWGQETTLPALREVYRLIFETGLRKLLAFVFDDNWQIKAIARKLGARREGFLRQQTMRGGKPVDMVILGLLREEFYELGGGGKGIAVHHDGFGGPGGRAGEQTISPDADQHPDGDHERDGEDTTGSAT